MELETQGTQEQTATGATDAGQQAPQTDVQTTGEQTWTPNYKFKVYDKEMEMPEDFRGYIKDAATEKKFKELFEKSHALDSHKAIHQKVLGNLDEFKSKATTYESRLQETLDGVKRLYDYSQNDLDTFFDLYKIPPEKLVNWVRNYLTESQLPEDERAQRQQLKERARQASFAELENQRSQRNHQSQFMQQHQMLMDMALMQPGVSDFQSRFDSKFGEGEFMRHVNDYGDRIFRSGNGKYVSPRDCIAAVMGYYGKAFETQAPAQPQNMQQNQETPPVIPNVGSGRGSSPTKRKFKNLADLEKYAKEFERHA